MPYNGSGVYNAPSSPGAFNPAVVGQQGTPTDWNTLLTDIQNALSNVICLDGQTTITANIPFNGKKITNLGSATVATDAVNAGQLVDNGLTAADDTGAANTYAIAPAVAVLAYAKYQWFQFVALNANTGASTLNVSSLGVKTIKRPNGDDLVANDILAGALCDVMYDGTNFVLLDGGSNAINYSLLTTRGDLVARGATKPQRLALGTAGQTLVSNGTDAVWGATFLRSYIAGLTLATAGSSGTFGIAAGIAADSTNSLMMTLASAYTKTTGAWAVGSGNGALDTGTIANNTVYHAHLIERTDTGVTDILISLSATAPTLPTNYTLFRRIGSMWTNGSAQWRTFLQIGDKFVIAPAVDYSASATSAMALRTLGSVPTGIVVDVLGTVFLPAGGGLSSALQLAPAAMATAIQALSAADNSAAFAMQISVTSITTNTSAQINIAVTAITGTATFNTCGWIDRRGRDS